MRSGVGGGRWVGRSGLCPGGRRPATGIAGGLDAPCTRARRPRVGAWLSVHAAVLVGILGLAAAGCGSGPGGEGAGGAAEGAAGSRRGDVASETAGARQVIVLLDLSASQTPAMLAEARRFLDELVDRLSFGDRIVLLEVHRSGVRDSVRRWQDTLPRLPDPGYVSSRDRARLQGARDAARSVARVFFDSARAGKALHTDLFATLHIAAEYARDSGGRETILVLLSDMLQSARGIEMEGLRRMPPPGWLEHQREAGLLPELDGACVVVVGADATTADGAAVRDFWLDYFGAAGAHLGREDYRLLAPAVGELGCR